MKHEVILELTDSRTRRSQLTGSVSTAEAEAFLARHKPSSCTEVFGGWYWVRLPQKGAQEKPPTHDELGLHTAEEIKFREEGAELVDKLTNRCAEIKVCCFPSLRVALDF